MILYSLNGSLVSNLLFTLETVPLSISLFKNVQSMYAVCEIHMNNAYLLYVREDKQNMIFRGIIMYQNFAILSIS